MEHLLPTQISGVGGKEDVGEAWSQGNHLVDSTQGIALTSESHASLFYHDEEIIANCQAQVNLANEHISSLEYKLRDSIEECQCVRGLLYESETARHNEIQARSALHRHLRLEQHQHSGCAQTRQSVEEERIQARAEIDNLLMLNEMLRQEVDHGEKIIESMAAKISTYEKAAETVIASLKERAQATEEHAADGLNSIVGSPDLFTLVMVDEYLCPMPPAGPGTESEGQGSIDTLDNQPSLIPAAKRKSQQMLEGSDGGQRSKVKISRKSKTGHGRETTKVEHL